MSAELAVIIAAIRQTTAADKADEAKARAIVGDQEPDGGPRVDALLALVNARRATEAAVRALLTPSAADADAVATRPPLGNIRVLPSEPLRECVVVWMERAARADHACPRCGLNRTYYVCDQCLGELDAILAERGPRWMFTNQERNTDLPPVEPVGVGESGVPS